MGSYILFKNIQTNWGSTAWYIGQLNIIYRKEGTVFQPECYNQTKTTKSTPAANTLPKKNRGNAGAGIEPHDLLCTRQTPPTTWTPAHTDIPQCN